MYLTDTCLSFNPLRSLSLGDATPSLAAPAVWQRQKFCKSLQVKQGFHGLVATFQT